jgi:hypothetical protein
MQNQTVGRKFCGDEGVILAAVTRRLPFLNDNAGEARVTLLEHSQQTPYKKVCALCIGNKSKKSQKKALQRIPYIVP